MEVGEERVYIYLPLHCHNQNDSCIKMGSDESHFNVSVGKPQTTTTEEKEEPRQGNCTVVFLFPA